MRTVLSLLPLGLMAGLLVVSPMARKCLKWTLGALLLASLWSCTPEGNPLLSANAAAFKAALSGSMGWTECAAVLYGYQLPKADPNLLPNIPTCIGIVQRNVYQQHRVELTRDEIVNEKVRRRFTEAMKNE
ncbi:hypothetical protein [Burkholderia pseudomallei]|uniref:hypothetical protein n=1 Tax=Burkholderia pseudomallei TaxID=28450 RepID=UPI00050FBB05|nr:hypothetical protein [Burkholderia pseudomallei]AIV49014.1 hypothetical protein X988_3120 [Burkholderia pseudomallei TSV 48]KGC33353.1 hypothetical protein DO64_4128 [Burkholderia pseudomallei]KGD46250.1 hypothetical protein DP43_3484 [Burkholderia pseudomallei]KGD46283.1 hypothetical protein DP43_3489 [Burkholderia pseudomallei]KGW05671.1 hypothetical protein X899_1495 [Burkholderia pseudomallei TSV 25]